MCVYFDQIYWEWRDERQPATGRFRHGHCTKQDQSRCVILRLQTCQIQDSSWKEWHVPNFGIGGESASKHEGEGRERRGDLAQKLQRSHSSNFRHAARFRPRTRKRNCTKSSSATAKKNIAETDQNLKTNQEKLPPLQKTLESTESWHGFDKGPIVRITPETRQSCCEETLQKM